MKTLSERETTNFWNIAGELRHAISEGGTQEEIDLLIDELDSIAMHTDSDTLRARCRDLTREIRPRQAGVVG